MEIQLTIAHRGGPNSDSFSGRPNGRTVRDELKLSTKDKDSTNYTITIPNDTVSFNPSFYLGLFFDSITHLKSLDSFKKKYAFDLSNLSDEVRESIEDNLAECERKATNELLGQTGLDFINN